MTRLAISARRPMVRLRFAPACQPIRDALLAAWRNRRGRLSGRAATRCLMISETNRNDMPEAITAWADLTAHAGRLFAGGLQDRGARRDPLSPARTVGTSKLRRDPSGAGAAGFRSCRASPLLILPHTPQTENAIRILEQHETESTRTLLGLLRLRHESLVVEPVAIHGDHLINLTLDGLPPNKVDVSAPAIDEKEDDLVEPEAEAEPEMLNSTSPLGVLLMQTAEQLEAIADGGVRSARDIDRLRSLSSRCASLGLASVARPIARLADELDRLRKSIEADTRSPAGTLLRAYYIVTLAAAKRSSQAPRLRPADHPSSSAAVSFLPAIL